MVATRIGSAAFLLLLAACAKPLETIRIDGSPGVAPLVSALVTEYRARHPSAMVVMASGLGSSARLRAVEERRIDIAMASHGLNAADLEKRGLIARPIAKTAVVFAVHAGVPVTALTSQQICDIYAGRITNWRELGGPDLPIRAATRPPGEVDADVALEGSPCLRNVTYASGVQMVERPDDMARAIAETVGGFGLTSAPMVEQSTGRIKSVTLDGQAPSVDNVASDAYPLARSAVLVYRKPAAPAVEQLLAFIGSPDGARIIRSNGAVPSN